MAKLNIDFLIKTPIKNILEEIDYYFHLLLQEIESYLNLEVIYTKIDIILTDEESKSGASDNIFSLGVDRSYKNEILNIKMKFLILKYIQILLNTSSLLCFVKRISVLSHFLPLK